MSRAFPGSIRFKPDIALPSQAKPGPSTSHPPPVQDLPRTPLHEMKKRIEQQTRWNLWRERAGEKIARAFTKPNIIQRLTMRHRPTITLKDEQELLRNDAAAKWLTPMPRGFSRGDG